MEYPASPSGDDLHDRGLAYREPAGRKRDDLGRRDRAPAADEMDGGPDAAAWFERYRGRDPGLQPDASGPVHALLRQRRRPRQRELSGHLPALDGDRDLPRQESVQPLAG